MYDLNVVSGRYHGDYHLSLLKQIFHTHDTRGDDMRSCHIAPHIVEVLKLPILTVVDDNTVEFS